MVAAGNFEVNFVGSFESENNPVTPVYSETPVFLLEGLQLLSLKPWMKGIFAKQSFRRSAFL
jgi:hypothetical protein